MGQRINDIFAATDRELKKIEGRFPWFTTPRLIRYRRTKEADVATLLYLQFKPCPVNYLKKISPVPATGALQCDSKTETETGSVAETGSPAIPNVEINLRETGLDELIDNFLSKADHRIVPRDTTPDDDFSAPYGDIALDDPDMMTEELAEILRAQGLLDKKVVRQ